MEKKLVSIVIPSYNQGKFISETIQSCLNQNYRPIEIIVQDGASKDETLSVLRNFNAPELLWLSEPDEGVTSAVNKALKRARGDFLTIQSSDDAFLPGAIRAAVEVFQDDPRIGIVYGDVEHMDDCSRVIGADILDKFDLSRYLGRFTYIPQPGTFFSRKAMEAVGGWRDTCSYAADADYWMRIATQFPVRKLDRVMARYRYHLEQRDKQSARIAADWEWAVRDLIASGCLTRQECRYARMGIHLARYRYAPEKAWLSRTVELYKAALINPGAILDRHFPKRELFPGREPIWKVLSKVKRKLGFKPRAA